MQCACGKTAMYRVGKMGFCSDHRSNAVKINALVPRRGSSFVSDKSANMAHGGGSMKVFRPVTNPARTAKDQRKKLTAQELRKQATGAEMQLLAVLDEHPKTKNRYRFQEVLCGFFPDFVNHWEKIAVEVNGWHHTTPEGHKRDAVRINAWRRKGYKTIMFYNREVLSSPENCLQAILAFQKGDTPSFGKCYPIAVPKAPLGTSEGATRQPALASNARRTQRSNA